jgi:hypothetical protein
VAIASTDITETLYPGAKSIFYFNCPIDERSFSISLRCANRIFSALFVCVLTGASYFLLCISSLYPYEQPNIIASQYLLLILALNFRPLVNI